METSRKRDEKQGLVNTEIIQAGYDFNDFNLFLQEKRADGTDIDTWTFSQLQYVIIQSSSFVS